MSKKNRIKGLLWRFNCEICNKDWWIEGTMPYQTIQKYYKETLDINQKNYVTCTKCQEEVK